MYYVHENKKGVEYIYNLPMNVYRTLDMSRVFTSLEEASTHIDAPSFSLLKNNDVRDKVIHNTTKNWFLRLMAPFDFYHN